MEMQEIINDMLTSLQNIEVHANNGETAEIRASSRLMALGYHLAIKDLAEITGCSIPEERQS